MPVKRRIEKSRSIDEWKMSELFHGPGTCLLAGLGYFRGHLGGYFHNITPEQQAEMIEAMRLDWEIHHARIMKEANAAGIKKPWALIEFGEIT